jgi:hypothetical protein
VKYHGFPDGTLGLTSIELRSSRWGLKIGDKELSPGTDVASLDAAVRQTAVPENHSKKAEVSGVGVVYVAKPNTAKSGEIEPMMNGLTQFNFNVDETGTVEVVCLSRVPPSDPDGD